MLSSHTYMAIYLRLCSLDHMGRYDKHNRLVLLLLLVMLIPQNQALLSLLKSALRPIRILPIYFYEVFYVVTYYY